MLGSRSLRIPSLVGAPVLCSRLSLGVLALLAPPACPGLVPQESDKPGLNVLLGEAGFVHSGVFLAPALPWSRFCWSGGCGQSLECGSGPSSPSSLEDEGTGLGGYSWCCSEQWLLCELSLPEPPGGIRAGSGAGVAVLPRPS